MCADRKASAPGAPAGAAQGGASGPVMLALSTFRRAESTVNTAIGRATACGELVLVYVVDVNLARYFIGADIGMYPHLREKCEDELLKEYEEEAQREVKKIFEKARAQKLEVRTYVETGRFALVCLDVVKKERPSLIVTRRSHRPEWVKKFFGSPVDNLIAEAGCPVIEA